MYINGVGGDCPGKTELHADVLRAAKVFVEYEPQTRVEGDIQQLLADFPVTELWRVLARQVEQHFAHAGQLAAVTVFVNIRHYRSHERTCAMLVAGMDRYANHQFGHAAIFAEFTLTVIGRKYRSTAVPHYRITAVPFNRSGSSTLGAMKNSPTWLTGAHSSRRAGRVMMVFCN